MCPTGEVCVYPEGVLCTTKLDVRFKGRPAHPTMSPHLGRNALACACTCVSELLGMARHGKGIGCINVGMMQAGEGRNVIRYIPRSNKKYAGKQPKSTISW